MRRLCTLRVFAFLMTAAAVLAKTAAVQAQLPVPRNTAKPVVSGKAHQGDTLRASKGSWSNSPTSYRYQWRDCNGSGASCSNIARAAASSYKLASSDVGRTVDVVVTAINAGGSARAWSGPTATVVPPAPANSASPVVSGTTQPGHTLTASKGSWSNSPTRYTYQWRDCNGSGASCSNIARAAASSYKLASSDVGHTVDVVVTASNAGGSARAWSAATSAVGSGSSTLPKGVTLQAIDGGSAYYCSHGFTQACRDGWDSSSFFPIGPFWGNYAGEQATWKAVDWNTVFYTTSTTDVNDLAANGLYSIVAASGSTPAATPNNNTVGFDSADEPGSWSAATSGLVGVSNSLQDSRFWYVNDTWSMAEYGPPSGTPGGTDADFFSDSVATPDGSSRHFDSGSIDTYWFSAANDSQFAWTGIGGVLYNGGSYGEHPLTAAETECGCRYGDMIRSVFGTNVGLPSGESQASWHTTYPGPIFQYVEDGNIGAHADVNITPPEMNWAVWSSIVHGARGIIYFDHEFGGSCISDNYVTTSCAHSDPPGQSRSIYSQMIATDSAVKSLAPEINSETALHYETVRPAPTTFGGIEARAVWDTNPSDCKGQASCFYIFADTRDAETASNIGATFTTVGNYSGPIPVVGESRTVTATNGTFNDTFAQGSTVHIYGPIPNQ